MDRREARRAAARLRGMGKMVAVATSDEERLRMSQQVARSEDTYADAAACARCGAARARSGDPSALCDEHLRRAMGL